MLVGGRPIDDDTPRRWDYRRVPVARFGLAPISDLRLAFRTFFEIVRRKPQAVHLITLKPAVVSGLAMTLARVFLPAPSRLVITIAGLGRLMAPARSRRSLRLRAARRVTESVVRFLSRSPKAIFTFETDHDRCYWLDHGLVNEHNAIAIAGAGVHPGTFFPATSRKPSGVMRVLFASRLLRAKGVDVFVKTARRFADDPTVEFLVAGIGAPGDPDAVPPEELSAEPSIVFLGEVTAMGRLLREVDLVCLPTSYGEGIPRILIEAAATGLPAVASDLEGCRAIVEDGISGRLVTIASRAATMEALVAAIALYRDNPEERARHGVNAYERFLAGDFSEAAVVERFVELLVGDGPFDESGSPAVADENAPPSPSANSARK